MITEATGFNEIHSSSMHTSPAYVDWPAIVAGAMLSTSISVLFMAFGSTIGLTMASPYRGEGSSGSMFIAAIGLWTLWVVVSSMMAGGYLAGRMRRRIAAVNDHEVEVRDGIHGLVVWALGTLVATYLAASAASGVAKAGVEIAKAGVEDASVSAAKDSVIEGYYTERLTADRLLRSTQTATAQDVSRLLVSNASTDSLRDDDQQFLAEVVVARTGMSMEDAEARVVQAVAETRELARKARQAAEMTRKVGVLIGFLTAASLVAGAAGAWWAATRGGCHRDQRTDFSRLTRWA